VSSLADVESVLADYRAHRILDAHQEPEASVSGSPTEDLSSLASRCG